jgi:hypothetical protein
MNGGTRTFKKVMWLGATALCAALVAIPVIGWAEFGVNHDFKTNRKAAFYRDDPVATSSDKFEDFEWEGPPSAVNAPTISAKGIVTATISAQISGGRAGVRMTMSNRVLHPGAVEFDPATGTSSFSFSFTGNLPHKRCWDPTIQFRSLDGDEVTLDKVDLIVDYKYAKEKIACPQ